ncbi:MAG: IS66 family transposase [Burkholderiales bacterium]|nr:IS66 family transposase [Burkholderiales bacterium]
MPQSLDQLPDDIETLKRLLIARDAEVEQQRIELEAKHGELEAQRAEVVLARLMIEKLKLEIARLRRIQFGRRSERHDDRVTQLELIVEELETTLAAMPVTPVPSMASVSPPAVPVRRPPPAHLPRENVVHAAPCACPDCGGALKPIGEDVSEQLEYIPEHFKVIRHVRPKFACGRCSTLVQAPAPVRPIDKGLAGPGLLAHVAVSKYLDHLPLYRQSEIYARQGVDLDRSTLADWVGGIARLVTPLAELIGRHVMAAGKVHADDTAVPVLDPGRGKTKTGRLWVYVRDDRPAGSTDPPAAFYRYTPTREGAHPRLHLKAFRGTLQADGYSGFDGLYVEGNVQEAACWAHARRKFYELHAAHKSPLAEEALKRIKALYEIEALVRGRPPDERRHARQEQARLLLDGLKVWLEATLARVPIKSELAAAINYSLKRWQALTRYCGDGAIEIDNNAAERALRGPVLSRKNFLFAGADSGGERAAVLYTLLETAKLNDLNPEAYLRFVLERIAEQPSNRLAELLPWSFARQLASADERLAA